MGQNGVEDAEGKNDGGGGRRHSRWLMWWSWELRGCMVAGNGGDDGGGG